MSDLLRITERYRLDKLIHASDTASVFRATDLRSAQTVALKLIRGDVDESPRDGRDRFEIAAAALQECLHPCLPRLFDHGFTGAGSAFLVLEYLLGANFELLAGSPPGRALPLLLPVLDGLEELDRHQLSHRNLRPDNLLLVAHGEEERLVILGWGTAAAAATTASEAGDARRRADLRGFAEITCAAIGAEIQQPSLAVILPPGDAADAIADASELAMLLSLLLQPGLAAPASLYAELRRAFRQALLGDAGPAAAPAIATLETPGAGEAVDLDQTRAVAADVTIAVPRDRLLGALDRFSAPAATGAVQPAPPGASLATAAVPSHAPEPAAGRHSRPWQRRAATTARLPRAVSPFPPTAAAPQPGPRTARERREALPAGAKDQTGVPGETGAPRAPRKSATTPATGAPSAAGTPPRAGSSRRGQPRRRWAAGAAAGAALVAILVLALLRGATAPSWLGQPGPRRQPAPAPDRRSTAPAGAAPRRRPASTAAATAASPAPAGAPPGAAPAGDPHLKAAAELLAAGDTAGARQQLAQISTERQAAFAPAERADYDQLAGAVSADLRRQIAADLAAALRRGDMRRLRAALTAAKWERDLPAAVRRDLDRARQAVDLDGRLARADLAQAPQEALRNATDLLALLPRYPWASELREQAAKAIEDQADAALAAGDGERGATLLAGLRQAWPDRPGLAERSERLDAQRRADGQLEAMLAAAGRAEAAGQPLQGLEALGGVNPGARYRERFRRQRERLEELLARLDAAPPTIALAAGFKLEYEKGARIAVPLRITDDLAVASAECWVRPEGAAAFQAVPVRHLSGADYEVDIAPELHQNRTVELYALASDHSGHRSLLGSREQPLKLKRRTWIEKIFAGKEGGHGGAGR
jgi:hypothetical protein